MFPTNFDYTPSLFGRAYDYEARCADELHPGPPYYTGGNLALFKYSDDLRMVGKSTYSYWLSPTMGARYVGGFLPSIKPGFAAPYLDANNLHTGVETGNLDALGDISSYGATGWKKFRPGNPTADLGVFLGELRDVPRMLKGTAEYFHRLWKSMGGSSTAFRPRAVADAWLNTQFGWMPFISDLRKFYRTYKRLDATLQRIKDQNGKWIKRQGTVSMSSDSAVLTSSASSTAHWPILGTDYYRTWSSSGNYTVRDVISRKVWFEGSFRYWIPDTESVSWRTRAIAEIFGAMPCPSLIWELTPWSWLVDWHSNVGDVIANMSTGWADNLAARYAYVMGTTHYDRTVESMCDLKSGPLYHVWTYPITWKVRVGANPFGFGLTDADLSARQWSILAALGIVRVKS